MTLPLYKETEQDAPKQRPEKANAGLWYDKFCNEWCRNPKLSSKEKWTLESFKERQGKDEVTVNPKANWIATVAGSSGVGDGTKLEEHRLRLTNFLSAFGQVPLPYKLESDFVTGLGREHPVENGFAWHHTLGTSYLPGSSVKGMVRAWAEQWHKWAGKQENELSPEETTEFEHYKKNLKCIFGDANETGVGSVIFLDALPTMPVQLKADVMTPHYAPYYQDATGQTPPADWHSPIPIPFLVVAAGQTFTFGVLPRHNNEKSQSDCETVKTWLKEALCWTGAGAKTAVGYGRFIPDEEMQKKAKQSRAQQEREAEARRQTELEQMSPILREMHEDGYETGDFIGTPIQKWLERLDKAEAEEKIEIARHLKTWYPEHRADKWEKPNKKNAAKIAPIKEVLGKE